MRFVTCKLASCSVQSDVERVLAHTCLAGPWNWFQLNIQGLCLPRPVFFFFFKFPFLFSSCLLLNVDNNG